MGEKYDSVYAVYIIILLISETLRDFSLCLEEHNIFQTKALLNRHIIYLRVLTFSYERVLTSISVSDKGERANVARTIRLGCHLSINVKRR